MSWHDEDDNTIDGDALARMNDAEIRNLFDETPAGSTLRQSFKDIVRVIAVHLVAGMGADGMTTCQSVKRGRDLLNLLQLLED